MKDQNKPMELHPIGEPPVWGGMLDGDIAAYQHGPLDKQVATFFACARTMYDNQVRDSLADEDRQDPSNNAEWLRRLALWFGWDDDLRDEQVRIAMTAATVILDHEMPGYEPEGA